MAESDLAARLDRVESELAIMQLPTRYALSVDARDIDSLCALFVDDIKIGGAERGVGREALATFFTKTLSLFYRSIHLVAGHVIEFDDADHAHGVVTCRAEHEVGDRWVLEIVNYLDRYERRDSRWYFERRRHQTLYSCDALERPRPPDFDSGWEPTTMGQQGGGVRLPAEHATYARFWEQFADEQVTSITSAPVRRAAD